MQEYEEQHLQEMIACLNKMPSWILFLNLVIYKHVLYSIIISSMNIFLEAIQIRQ